MNSFLSYVSSFRPEVFQGELSAQAITVRIRWIGLCIGYAVVNLASVGPNQFILNAILTLAAGYALTDTYYSVREQVFLNRLPWAVSAMEAVFIGLLCHYDTGLMSPFRFYYFLSLIVCAIRHTPGTTWLTCALHTASYSLVGVTSGMLSEETRLTGLLTPVLMAWVAWAGTSLAELLKSAGRNLSQLNQALQDNQALLELRIADRTRQLQQSQAMLVQHEKQAAFGLLAAGIAHEVGNPLAAISSLVQLLQRKPLDEPTREKLQLVDDQLRRIQRTLRELVDFSRPANSQRLLCDLDSVIDNALSIAKYYKRKKGKQIITHTAQELPPLWLVRDQLVQVLLNLVLNAMDATEEGGTIEITTQRTDQRVQLEVRDNGSGIEAPFQPRIFEPYFTTKQAGTGLGLFVCRNLIEQQGGTIELTRSDAAGTVFTIFLPLHDQTTEVPPADLPPAIASWKQQRHFPAPPLAAQTWPESSIVTESPAES